MRHHICLVIASETALKVFLEEPLVCATKRCSITMAEVAEND